MTRAMSLFAAVGLAASAATAQIDPVGMLVVPESSNERLMLFNAFDGSLVTDNFIDMVPQGASTPLNAKRVGDEIWVSDQVADSVFRYSLDGTSHLGTISGGMDNIRGFEVVGDTVYVSNAGTNNGAPGLAVVTIDVPTASVSGFFATNGSPFDVLHYQGQLLINDISNENIDWYDLSGNFISNFHDSDGVNGIDFPEQMTINSAGNVLVGGFSSPAGIYEYDPNGNQLNYWDVGTAVRGVHELGNGNIMFTDGGGVHILDPDTGTISTAFGGVSARFIELVVPAPSGLGLLAVAGLAAVRRRR
jgi:hypothetical protein